LAAGYFDDGTIDIELGQHVFGVPATTHRALRTLPHGGPAHLHDSGGGSLELTVTGQRVRSNLGDAEWYAHVRLSALARSDPGTLACEDNRGNWMAYDHAVCIGGQATVQSFRFVTMDLDFLAPQKSGDAGHAAAPAAPATYPGRTGHLDYEADGIAIGHHPVGLTIEMARQFPLREIPRARGARARGPRRGAEMRLTVRSHALVTTQHLSDYLSALARAIGPEPVNLTGNGNTYPGVVLEELRPAQTDQPWTAFDAIFVEAL